MTKLSDLKNLTASEKIVVEYIQSHENDLPDMTISKLAAECYTSNATIIRLCRKAGYEGFADLKKDLLRKSEAEKYVQRNVDFTNPVSGNENVIQVMGSLAGLYKESIDVLAGSLKASAVQTAAEVLNSAERLFIFAYGDSKVTAEGFANRLIKLNIFAVMATERSEELHVARQTGKGDAALIVSYGSSIRRSDEWVSVLKENGCRIVMISSDPESEAAKMAEPLILIPHEEKEGKVSTFYSQLAFTYVLNVIYALMYLKRKKVSQ